ncbi:MAG TPA: hypothetical protein VL463_10755 [Kofleriaceae bacterium]|jgi:hypothetical protein|nr:hypothetical protein [Kofleriaceae bacterium]
MTKRAAAAMIALAACSGGVWQGVPSMGAQVEAPAGATVEQTATHAFVGDGSFALNLFAVNERSPATADEQRALLDREDDFVRVTREERGDRTWRFDYALEDGKAGTIARIVVGGRALDCGVHGVAADVAARVGDACARVRPR